MQYPQSCLRYLSTFFVVALAPLSLAGAAEPAAVTYDQVRPVFKKHCVSCHGQERSRGDLNLSTTAGIQGGSSSGPVAIAGKPDESMLYTLAAHLEAPKMPPGAPKIPQRELDLIRRWIEDGLQVKMEVAAATSGSKPAMVKPVGGTEAVTPIARPTAITAVAVSPREPLIAVSGQRQVVLFAGSDRTPTKAFPFPEGDVFALRFSRDGELLLAGGGLGGASGKVVAIEVATGRRVFEVGDEPDVVLAFDLSPDRSLVALGGPGKSVNVYRTANGELMSTLRKHTDWILSVAFSPDGLLLASGDRFGGLQVWEAGTGKSFHTLRGHVGPVNTVGWSADSERLLSGGQDGTLRLWDMHQGTEAAKWDAQLGGVLTAQWTVPNHIVAGGRDRQVAIFSPDGRRERAWSLSDEVTELAVTADGSRLITGDAAGRLAAWTISTGANAGEYVIPSAPIVARTDGVTPPRKQRSPSTATPITTRTAPSLKSGNPQPGNNDLAVTREALADAEAAVKSAEDSLARLKASAAKLKQLVDAQESAAKRVSGRAPRP